MGHALALTEAGKAPVRRYAPTGDALLHGLSGPRLSVARLPEPNPPPLPLLRLVRGGKGAEAVEAEVDRRHDARMRGGAEAFVGMTAIDPR